MLSTVFIGGGPGGLGPLIWAAQAGLLPAWLSRGVAIVDRQPALGGTLGRYAINSDSLGGAYLEFLDAPGTPRQLRDLKHDRLTRQMEHYRHGFPPLALVDRFMKRIGRSLEDCLSLHDCCAFYRGTIAQSLHRQDDGTLEIRTLDGSGTRRVLEAQTAVVALGGRQTWRGAVLPQGFSLQDCTYRLLTPSDQLMTERGLGDAATSLRAHPGRPIVILGGSHSAYAAAWTLTHLLPSKLLEGRRILILRRRVPRVFYPSRADALSDGYPVDPGDICPRTQRVNRLGGLRGDGREMWRSIEARPGAAPESRFTVLPLNDFTEHALRRLLEDAAIVIPAFGYRSATLPIFDEAGRRLALNADFGGRSVAQDCRVLLRDGSTLSNVFGIGLGTGYRPDGAMGGEPNFDGQANSLWLYQNDIGAVIHAGITGSLDRHAAQPPAASVPLLAAAQ